MNDLSKELTIELKNLIKSYNLICKNINSGKKEELQIHLEKIKSICERFDDFSKVINRINEHIHMQKDNVEENIKNKNEPKILLRFLI